MSTHDVALSYSLVHADANPPQGDSASGIAKVSSADNPPTGPVVELQCIGCEDGKNRSVLTPATPMLTQVKLLALTGSLVALVSWVFQAKYFPTVHLFDAKLHDKASYAWKEIYATLQDLKPSLFWNLG
ncbi:hypothetical protein V6N11_056126 [Hibiscus sabdariffa]|uniref:Uncharacterized protein n=1 Tax=Hibiscus sabdariffa TaxID=183260 RepID=A0ABR2T2Y5_9ROSI